MYNQIVNKKLGLLLIALLCFPALSSAENQTGFYEKNSAKSVFGKAAKIKAPKEIVMLLPEKIEEDEKEVEEVINQGITTKAATSEITTTTVEDKNLSLEQQLQKKYGNPTEEFPVTGIDSAPVPFRAMIEALDKGDKELAFKYAVQYVRYRRQLEQVTNQAVSLVGQGYVREGVLPENSWASSPEHQENFYLRNLDIGEDKLKTEPAPPTVSKLSLKAQEIIKRSKEAKFNLVDQEVEKIDTETLKVDEKTEKEQAKKELKGKVPVDPKGQIDIYFFFDPQDKVAMGLAKDIEKIYEMSQKDKKLEFVGLTIDKINISEIEYFNAMTQTKIPFISGSNLAEQMDIKKSPTTVFVTHNTMQYYKLEEVKSIYYIEELIAYMQGVK